MDVKSAQRGIGKEVVYPIVASSMVGRAPIAPTEVSHLCTMVLVAPESMCVQSTAVTVAKIAKMEAAKAAETLAAMQPMAAAKALAASEPAAAAKTLAAMEPSAAKEVIKALAVIEPTTMKGSSTHQSESSKTTNSELATTEPATTAGVYCAAHQCS